MTRSLLTALLVALVLGPACRTPDETAPTVRFLTPADGDTLYAGTIALKTEAHDNIEVIGVRFYCDRDSLGATGWSDTDTFGIVWDATAETLGRSCRLKAQARDRAGNTGAESILVHFRKEIPPGALAVTTTPPGAAIWVDGVNTGLVSPDTVDSLPVGPHQVRLVLAHYDAVDTTITISGNQTSELTATLYGYAVVSGVVVWPGHSLSPRALALLDTSADGHGAYIVYGSASPSTGEFALTTRLSLPDSAYALGFDDVDGNGYPSSGDGRGFWDYNGDQQMTPADRFRIAPGDTIRNAQVVLFPVP